MTRIANRPRRASVVEALETTRLGMRNYQTATALVVLAFAEIGLAAALIVADVAWLLPFGVRAVGLSALVLLALAGLARVAIAPGRRYGKGDAAAEVESAFPELGQRVRTALEYAEPGPTTAPASRSLVAALVEETDRKTRGLPFATLVPWSVLGGKALLLAGASVAALAMLASDPNLKIAARRLLLRPAYFTTLAVKPGDATLRAGADFAFKAHLSGRPVAFAGWLSRRPVPGSKWEMTSLGADATGPRQLTGSLEASRPSCREDFEYKVVAGEVESPVYRVTITHPLVLKSIEAAIEPPAYTRRPPSVAKEADFGVLEGSKVRFRIALDRAPRSARLSWSTAEGEGSKAPGTIPLAIEGSVLRGELPPLARDVRYEVVAEAADGMRLEPATHRIRVRADEKPTVRFVKPAESHAATPTTEVPLKVEAADDHGLSKVGVSFRVGDGPEESLYLDDPEGRPATVEAVAMLYLEKHGLAFTDSLSYRGFVEDNRPDRPQKASTELRYIDILPYKQAFQIAEGGGKCDGNSVTLEELIARQRQALNRAFAHADEGTVEAGVADRLSKDEAQIGLATDDFARGLAARFGHVSPLEEAAQAMRMATVALAEKDLASAVPLEQTALASLIRARQNLRKLLSQSSSSGQCRKFDRQQEQKLRKPPTAEEKPKEAELARLEQDIRKLADERKQFAEEIDPKGGGGAQLEKEAGPKAGTPSKDQGPRPDAAARQQAAAKEANRLKALAREDKALTSLARERMDAAATEVKAADKALASGKPGEAAASAKEAAEQLERLAEQVAGLKAKDLAARLARAREMAEAAARAERELAGRGKAGPEGEPRDDAAKQAGLVEGARSLADVLKRIRSDATEEDRALARAIAKATEANAPGEIEQAMREASSALASGEPRKSAAAMDEAATRLEGLARDIEAVRRDFVQPRLEQLLAAERKAAEVDRALHSATDAARKAEAEKGIGELARALEALKGGEAAIRRASASVAEANRSAGTNAWTPPAQGGAKAGLFQPPQPHVDAVREASRALQVRIQELILNEALVDRDGAVPPGYKELVEDYFRVLSEDVR